MTGKQFNNIRSGQSRKSTSYYALSSCSMSRQRNEQAKQELPNDQCVARQGNLKNMVWQACSSKPPKTTQNIHPWPFPRLCANSSLSPNPSILTSPPMTH